MGKFFSFLLLSPASRLGRAGPAAPALDAAQRSGAAASRFACPTGFGRLASPRRRPRLRRDVGRPTDRPTDRTDGPASRSSGMFAHLFDLPGSGRSVCGTAALSTRSFAQPRCHRRRARLCRPSRGHTVD
ncbi:unnamed protein product, partial [Protopolystoma xenopodis]